MATPTDVVMLKFREIYPTGNRHILRYLPHKKFRLPLKLSLLRGSCPKSARASPNKSVHFWQSNSRTRQHCLFFCPIEYFHDRLFEPIIACTSILVSKYISGPKCTAAVCLSGSTLVSITKVTPRGPG